MDNDASERAARFAELPAGGAWQHTVSRQGFEVAWFRRSDGELLLAGCTTAIEEGAGWAVDYEIRVDGNWITRSARVSGRSGPERRSVLLLHDGSGSWTVDGAPAPQLTGCLDVDLESSVVTNTLPIHRLRWRRGEWRSTPAAYVRAGDLGVARLEQEYSLRGHDDDLWRFGYRAPSLGFAAELSCDGSGLVLEYPGIAVRAG